MNRSTRPRWIFALCALMLAIAVVFALQTARRSSDLSRQVPAQVFAQIFQTPIPAGVSNLKIAGESHLSGAFWMRFQTDDINATLNALRAKVRVNGPTRDPNGMVSRATVAQNRDAQAVNWNDTFAITKPELYEFSTVPAGTGWWGVLVVDRANQIVYARGELL